MTSASGYAATARAWVDRWDRQQETFLPEREAQFTALVDVVEETAGRPDPLVVDLGCGPGSIGVRLLRRIPAATVVSVDADPLLIELGRAAYAGTEGLRFADVDLRDPDWAAALGLDRQPDAVLSTTALHWLAPDVLASLYGGLTTLLRPGGILVNCDELERDRTASPVLSRLDRALLTRERARRARPDAADSWYGWWQEVQAEPAFAAAVAERTRRGYDGENHSDLSAAFAVHLEALQKAGFAEVGTLWQRGEVRLLCAVTHSPDNAAAFDEPHTHNHAPTTPTGHDTSTDAPGPGAAGA
ncbi:class I SAM-dependent methyltransferase [Streptomyces sp. NBC_00239]|uniref:class I SAM-dependent methyltransferase n=1 Tax=Streptomyces sp. NBC_00239 TaxID=2903640 RepID=UPI002E2A2092|nr:class I SAM-dependent methyltransferase [Streptomyces sp. NBC_00239]